MYIGVRAFGVNVRSNFMLIRHFDWPYKEFIVRSATLEAVLRCQIHLCD